MPLYDDDHCFSYFVVLEWFISDLNLTVIKNNNSNEQKHFHLDSLLILRKRRPFGQFQLEVSRAEGNRRILSESFKRH